MWLLSNSIKYEKKVDITNLNNKNVSTKTTKILILGFASIIVLVTILVLGTSNSKTYGELKGTYLNSDLPFVTMVFDLDDNNTFYFYDQFESDKGNYEKISESTYRINSENFNEQEITFNGDDEVRIEIDNETYTFKKDSNRPTIINEYAD